MASDVCKHCTDAACLEVCPTGALFRTEFGTVVVQEDVCNGCGYCVPACPFGVLDKRKDDGRVWKCTLCYDRLKDDKEPACAQACPTQVDPVRRTLGAARARRAPPRPAPGRRPGEGPALPGRRRRRRRAGRARSSCCSTSPRCTACRRIRSTRAIDLGRSTRPRRRRRSRWRPGWCGGVRRRSAMSRDPLLSRPAGDQGASVDVGDPRPTSSPAASPVPRRGSPTSARCAATRCSRAGHGRAAIAGRRRSAPRCSSPISGARSGFSTCCGCSR